MTLEEQVAQILQYNTVLPKSKTFNCKNIIDKWRENKFSINSYLKLNEGNNWIINYGHVELTLTDDEKALVYKSFLNCCNDILHEGVGVMPTSTYQELINLVVALEDITPKEFFKNQLNWTYSPKMVAGTKLVKNFKHYISDPGLLDKVQQLASDFIQKDKICGDLCISTNPLDFLSVSENTLKWRSCHNLRGLFCGGGLSYMVDPATVVCYIKTDTDVQLPHFPEGILWNNKKWRMMLHFSNNRDCVLGGRHYPFFSEAALREIHEKVLDSTPLNWSNFHVGFKFLSEYFPRDTFSPREPINIYDYDKVLNCGYRFVYPKKAVHEDTYTLNYDDILETSYPQQLSYAWNSLLFHWDHVEPNYQPYFAIGGNVPCPVCGKSEASITPLFEKGFACFDCAIDGMTNGYCQRCGKKLTPKNAVICSSSFYDERQQNKVEDKFLCADCADEEDK